MYLANELERAKDTLAHFFSCLPQTERIRIVFESSSEFSTFTKSIRGFYWGWVLPNAAEAILGISRVEAQNDKEKLAEIHLKLKMLILPRAKYHIVIDGKPVEKEGVGTLKNATVREWFVYIATVRDWLQEHYGVDVNQRDHEGYDDYVALAHKLQDNFKTKQEFNASKRRLQKNLSKYGESKPKNGT